VTIPPKTQSRGVARFLSVAYSIAIVAALLSLASQRSSEARSASATEREDFADSEIADGFFKIAFGAELQTGLKTQRIRRFDQPVRVFVASNSIPDRRADIAAVVSDIGARVRNLDIAITDDEDRSNIVVSLVRKRDFFNTIRAHYGAEKAKAIKKQLDPECLSGIAKDADFRITHADVIIPADIGDADFYNCAYEELLQSLGPINDDRSVPWTMFNDDVRMGFFDLYDQYLLNILYDQRIKPGMTRADVKSLLPIVLPDVRAWVARTNSLTWQQTGSEPVSRKDEPSAAP
jgi:hypothetical protein